MKKLIKNISYLLLVLFMLPVFSGCNNEDDVVDIFTGRTWKLTFIAAEGSTKQFDFWNGNETARKSSMDALALKSTFILNFVGSDLSEFTGGQFTGQGIKAAITGDWKANGETNKLTVSGMRTTQSETDALAKAFITGLQNAIRYEGDNNNLYIYYKEGQTTKFLALHPHK